MTNDTIKLLDVEFDSTESKTELPEVTEFDGEIDWRD